MEEPFLTIFQKKPAVSKPTVLPVETSPNPSPPQSQESVPQKTITNVNWERKMVYADFRRAFNTMVNNVISSHNEADFQKVSAFVDSENNNDKFPITLPTCLLVNSIFDF